MGAAAIAAAVAVAVTAWTPSAWAALALVTLGAIWIAGGAATALLGLLQPAAPVARIEDGWRPSGRTALLVLLCGEEAGPLATHLGALRRGADALGLGDGAADIFVLSDTRDPARIAAEEEALAPLVAAGAITYRRRADNVGRKPGNIADWLATRSDGYAYMLVLDADSRMSAGRVRSLIHRMESQPRLGLLQAGMAMVPGRSLFGRHQRLASRLLSHNFGRGLAAWSGEAGNYWGHNAIMRVAAFRSAVSLPVLSGRAPFGGPPLSHDFIEAAWIRRAGWAVALDPDMRGSAEDGPQTLAEFHKRDRRWCQGNLQHVRLIAEPGLDPVSRLHLASGIASYLAAPVWFALVGLVATGSVRVEGALPLVVVAGVLLLPKLCALGHWLVRARTAARRALILRASLGELALSTLIAPLVMVRQTAAVLSVLSGRDCGWKSGRAPRLRVPAGVPEAAVGLALVAVAAATEPASSAAWLLPVALPLLGAPLLQRLLDRGA
nr:glucans biosynthesis glucosyltransferase MdoH [Roseibacterium persicicum]